MTLHLLDSLYLSSKELEKMKFIPFIIILGSKVILTEVIGITLVLLCFLIKGRFLTSRRLIRKDWNAFFIAIPNRVILLWGAAVYFLSSIVASCIAYVLFCRFNVRSPIVCTGILFLFCTGWTCANYHRKEKRRILEKISSLRQTAKEELNPS